MSNRDIRQKIIISAKDKTKGAITTVKSNLTALDRSVKRITNTLLGLAGVHVFIGTIKGMITLSDQAKQVESKLKLVTKSVEEFNFVYNELFEISKRTTSSFTANVALFNRVRIPMQNMGMDLKATTDFIETFNATLKLSGAGASEASSAVLQISQALASGVLSGDEFRSMMENNSKFMINLADAMGVSIGKLRQMSKQQKLTAEVVLKYSKQMHDGVVADSQSMTRTFGQSWQILTNEVVKYFKEGSVLVDGMAKGVELITENFQAFVTVVKGALVVGFLVFYNAVKGYWTRQRAQWAQEKKQNAIEKKRQSDKIKHLEHRKLLEAQMAVKKAEQQHTELMTEQRLKIVEAKRALAKKKALLQEAYLNKINNTSSKDHLANIGKEAIAKKEYNLLLKEQALMETELREMQVLSSTRMQDALKRQSDAMKTLNKGYESGKATIGQTTSYITRFGKNGEEVIKKHTMSVGGMSTLWGKVGNQAKVAGNKMKGALAKMKGMGAGLTDVILLAGTFGYMYTKDIINYAKAWQYVETTMKGVGTNLALIIDLITSPFDTMKDLLKGSESVYAESIKSIHEEHKKGIEQSEKDFKAIGQGFADEADMMKRKHDELRQAEIVANDNAEASEKRLHKAIKDGAKIREQILADRLASVDTLSEIVNASLQVERDTRAQSIIDEKKNIEDRNKQLEDLDNELQLRLAENENKATQKRFQTIAKHYETIQNALTEGSRAWIDARNKRLDAEIGADKAILKSHQSTYDVLLGQYNNLIDKAQEYTSKAEGTLSSFQEFQRTVFDAVATDYEKSVQRQKDINEAYSEIRKANTLDEIEDINQITELRDSATKTLEDAVKTEISNLSTVKKDSVEYYDIKSKIDRLMRNLKDNTDALADAQKANAKTAKDRAEQIHADLDIERDKIQSIIDRLSLLDDAVTKSREVIIQIDDSRITESINNLNRQFDELSEKARKVGELAKASARAVRNARDGIDTPLPAHSKGGYIYDNKGKPTTIPYNSTFSRQRGRVNGSNGRGDTVQSMLEYGEFVMSRKAVDDIGVENLKKLNDGKEHGLMAYSTGGLVSDAYYPKTPNLTTPYLVDDTRRFNSATNILDPYNPYNDGGRSSLDDLRLKWTEEDRAQTEKDREEDRRLKEEDRARVERDRQEDRRLREEDRQRALAEHREDRQRTLADRARQESERQADRAYSLKLRAESDARAEKDRKQSEEEARLRDEIAKIKASSNKSSTFNSGTEDLKKAIDNQTKVYVRELSKQGKRQYATVAYATGGSVFKPKSKLITEGAGGKDDVPSMLMRGEYVINKKAVDRVGVDTLDKINNYADGGLVESVQRKVNAKFDRDVSNFTTSNKRINVNFPKLRRYVDSMTGIRDRDAKSIAMLIYDVENAGLRGEYDRDQNKVIQAYREIESRIAESKKKAQEEVRKAQTQRTNNSTSSGTTSSTGSVGFGSLGGGSSSSTGSTGSTGSNEEDLRKAIEDRKRDEEDRARDAKEKAEDRKREEEDRARSKKEREEDRAYQEKLRLQRAKEKAEDRAYDEKKRREADDLKDKQAKERLDKLRKELADLKNPKTTKPTSSNNATGTTRIREAFGTGVRRFGNVLNNVGAAAQNSLIASKKVSPSKKVVLDLKLGGKTIEGTFNDTPETTNIIQQLQQSKGMSI